jgi:hypothetical protein
MHEPTVEVYTQTFPCLCDECIAEAVFNQHGDSLVRANRSGKVHVVRSGVFVCGTNPNSYQPFDQQPRPDQFCQNCFGPLAQDALTGDLPMGV